MASKTVYTEVEIDVDLEDFDTDDLIDELASRGHKVDEEIDVKELIEAIFHKRRLGMDYQVELDELIYSGLGRLI